ncbi:MAG: BolA family protein [Gammaproteobacteria bacterium]
MMSDRIQAIRDRLETGLEPVSLDITDESHLHIGHPGAAGGAGHFSVRIVSPKFSGQSLLERHRMVYAAVEDLMQTEIHALSIKADTPEEES